MIDTGPCDHKCPVQGGLVLEIAPCCRNCVRSRRYFLTDANNRFWTHDAGFLGLTGCNLPRDMMPAECKAYDCKKDLFYVTRIQYSVMAWKDNKWVEIDPIYREYAGELRFTQELLSAIYNRMIEHNKEIIEKYKLDYKL